MTALPAPHVTCHCHSSPTPGLGGSGPACVGWMLMGEPRLPPCTGKGRRQAQPGKHEPRVGLTGSPGPCWALWDTGHPHWGHSALLPALPTLGSISRGKIQSENFLPPLQPLGAAAPTDDLCAKHPLLQPQDFEVKLSDQREFTEVL